jgi:hypothetical protein
MSEPVQHLVVLLVVGLCVGYILWQAFGTVLGGRSSLGKCCEKGCEAGKVGSAAGPAGGTQFIPSEALSKGRGKA